MTDSRPAENTDDRPTFPVMNELFGRPGVPTSAEDIQHHETELPEFGSHKADAIDWLKGAERPDINGTMTSAIAAIAATHATLYLAEQQRIANLIAWQQLTGESNRAEIRKGLGL